MEDFFRWDICCVVKMLQRQRFDPGANPTTFVFTAATPAV
jgi:hypothetical protein